jgi:hypothetical protein
MACRGVHFALSAEDEQELRACPADDRPALISSDIEDRYFEPPRDWLCQTDKAWDAIHRALNASGLGYEYRSPLHGVILGGEPLYFKDDCIISLKSPDRVRDVARALAAMDEAIFRQLYFAIDTAKYQGPVHDEDFAYAWDWLRNLGAFYWRAADAGRSVIFTTDQ